MNEPMKCQKALRAFNDSRMLFEPKLDGYRCKVINGDTTLDGEVAVLDAGGVPRLRLVQQRGKSDRLFLATATRDFPATYYPFDILAYKGQALEHYPTLERKHILADVVPSLQRNGTRCYSSGGEDITARFPELQDPTTYKTLPYLVGDGVALYDKVCGAGWEGIVAKPLEAPYEYGNRGVWKKIKRPRIEGKFQVCGACYPRPGSNREGWVGSVILGEVTPAGLVYRGEAGTGFNFAELAWLTSTLHRQDASPFPTPPKYIERFWFWCRPSLSLEVDCFERTQDDMLREPVVKRILR
jgi:bifunctional non-homologous end joining protein LigD